MFIHVCFTFHILSGQNCSSIAVHASSSCVLVCLLARSLEFVHGSCTNGIVCLRPVTNIDNVLTMDSRFERQYAYAYVYICRCTHTYIHLYVCMHTYYCTCIQEIIAHLLFRDNRRDIPRTKLVIRNFSYHHVLHIGIL